MKITLITVGKTDENYIKTGVEKYEKLISNYCSIDFITVSYKVKSKKISKAEIQKKEAELIESKLKPGAHVVLLDEKGKSYTSNEFSVFINKKMISGIKNLVFIIGGAYGFDKDFANKANHKIALSKMTFTHQMVRLFFMEQVYRAFTIIRNEPYHND